jgi:hypothetical protein
MDSGEGNSFFQRELAIVEELERGTPLDEVDKKTATAGCSIDNPANPTEEGKDVPKR